MMSTGYKIEAALMIVISIAINAAFLYGVASKPSISYHLSTPLNYNETIDFTREDLQVDLETKNSGPSEASVWLVVTFYNMTLRSPEGLTVSHEDGAMMLRVPWISHAEESKYDSFETAFHSMSNFTYAFLVFSIEVSREADLATRFHNSFAVYYPERPTAILLKNVGDGRFMRVSSR